MAAIGLKDLMNPLTKISHYTDQTSKKIDKVIELLSKPTTEVSSEAKNDKTTIKDSGMLVNSLESLAESVASLDASDAYIVILDLSASIGELSDSVERFGANTSKQSVARLSVLIGKISNIFGDVDKKELEEDHRMLGLISESINEFAKSIVKSAVLLLASAVAIPLLYLSVASLIPLFTVMGNNEEQLRDGAFALRDIGYSLSAFGVGIGLFALSSYLILSEPTVLLSMFASVTLMATAIAFVGRRSKDINKGSLSLAGIGLSLIPFSLGYTFFAMSISGITLGEVLIQSAAIGGIGLAVGLIGKLPLLGGALGLSAIGLSLLVFSTGYTPFREATSGLELEDIGIQAAVLLGIGTMFSLAGLVVPFMLAGALGFGAAGLALQALAPGLESMKDLDYSKEDGQNLATTLAAVAMAFSGTDSESGFFSNVGKAFTRIGETGTMLVAAEGYEAAGKSLITLSEGLGKFKNVEFTEDDSKTLAITLGSITAGFAQAGGEPANPGGIFGAVFGNVFSPNAVERGINSVMGAGNALKDIAQGIMEFQSLIDSNIDFDVVGGSIKKTVGFIQQAFAAVGEEGNVEGGGFFNSLFNIKQNKVTEGIISVQGAGDALTDIAKGITEFDKLVKSDIDWDSVGAAITKTVGFVQQAFAAIGGEGNVEGGGFFNSLFNIKQNKVAEGISSVQGAGTALTDVAKGITEFDKLVKSDIDWDSVGSAIEKTLGFVGTAFARIGGMESNDSWFVFSWDESLVQKGIAAVSGAGEELKNIVSGLKTISEISDPEKVAKNLGLLLSSLGDNFKMLYEKNPEINDKMSKVGTFISDLSLNAKKGYLSKAADGFKGIAESINSIELEKSDSLGNLFKYASEISNDENSILRLTAAVDEIRNLMVAKESVPAPDAQYEQPVQEATAGSTVSDSPDINVGKLTTILSKIDTTLSNLPSAIASIEIVLPEE